MTLIPTSKTRNVNGISPIELNDIFNFLQGAVYCWCKNRKYEWFSLRSLMGGDNFYWETTPLMSLFDKHKALGKTNDVAIKDAGKDCGWILKSLLQNDSRDFEHKKEDLIRKYRWVAPSHE